MQDILDLKLSFNFWEYDAIWKRYPILKLRRWVMISWPIYIVY